MLISIPNIKLVFLFSAIQMQIRLRVLKNKMRPAVEINFAR